MTFSQFGAYGPEAYINKSLENVKPEDIKEKDTLNGVVEWAGNGDRYFISCIVPVKPVESVVKLFLLNPLLSQDIFNLWRGLIPVSRFSYLFNATWDQKV